MYQFYALSILCIVSQAGDWDSVLRADITCCPPHTTKETCENEGSTVCDWIDDATDPIAVAGGSQCLGDGYVTCKSADINAVCVPPGNPPPAPAPPGETPSPVPPVVPVCFPLTTATPTTSKPTTAKPTTAKPTTSKPTSKPTTKWPTRAPIPPTPACELGVNYEFEGYPCTMSGDPHTKLFNGNNHDFQGQPDKNGKNQFYYVHTCDGAGPEQMPFNILATHYKWKTYPVSGIDYLTIELFDTHAKQDYLIFLSSKLHSYTTYKYETETHKTKYENNAAGSLMDLPNNKKEYIGSRFTVLYNALVAGEKASLTLTIDNQCEVKIYMQKQTNYVDGRYRMHLVWIKQSPCYKCHTCGLCGNFQDLMTGAVTEYLETCDGEKTPYKSGWNAAVTPEAYDPDGWTWEKNYVLTECKDYDITNNNGNFVYVDPCAAHIKDSVKAKCDAARQDASDCCNTIGYRKCDDLLKDCYYDACVEADGQESKTDDAVAKIFTNPLVETLCNIPNIGDKESDFTAGLIVSTQNNHYKPLDMGAEAFKKLLYDAYGRSKVAIIRRECAGCSEDYKDIYYRRISAPRQDGFHPYHYMQLWESDDNCLGEDFELFSTLEDAIKGTNGWSKNGGECNYDDIQHGIGAFRDCGKHGLVIHQWCSSKTHSTRECRFSIYTGPPPEIPAAELVSSHGSSTCGATTNSDFTPGLTVSKTNKVFDKVDMGADAFAKLLIASYGKSKVGIIRRECAGCSQDYKDIYYRRLSGLNGFHPYHYMVQWNSNDNIFGKNFDLYSTLEDAIKGNNAWSKNGGACSYDHKGVGAFGGCGIKGTTRTEFCSKYFDTGRECRFSIYTGIPKRDETHGDEWEAVHVITSDIASNNNIGLALKNEYIYIFLGVFVIFLYGVVKYTSNKRNDKYIPIKDPISSAI